MTKTSFKLAWLITLLIGGYVCFQLVADVSAAKIIQIGSLTLPGGTFVFALTFTWRDLVHKRLGRDFARAAIIVAALANVFMALYFVLVIQLPVPVFYTGAEAFAQTLAVVPRITVASILAELVSELIDTEAYHLLANRFTGRWQFVRVLLSNAVSLPIDSAIFAVLAFGGLMPVAGLIAIASGQMIFKGLVTLVSLPGIYLVKEDLITSDPVGSPA